LNLGDHSAIVSRTAGNALSVEVAAAAGLAAEKYVVCGRTKLSVFL
jgi:hypothetical protein